MTGEVGLVILMSSSCSNVIFEDKAFQLCLCVCRASGTGRGVPGHRARVWEVMQWPPVPLCLSPQTRWRWARCSGAARHWTCSRPSSTPPRTPPAHTSWCSPPLPPSRWHLQITPTRMASAPPMVSEGEIPWGLSTASAELSWAGINPKGTGVLHRPHTTPAREPCRALATRCSP